MKTAVARAPSWGAGCQRNPHIRRIAIHRIVTRVVQLSDEAYDHLRQLKRPGDSFSDVVLRLTARASWDGLRGLRSPERIAQARAALSAVDALDDAEVRAWRSSTRRS